MLLFYYHKDLMLHQLQMTREYYGAEIGDTVTQQCFISTDRASKPAFGTCFIKKIISLTQAFLDPRRLSQCQKGL